MNLVHTKICIKYVLKSLDVVENYSIKIIGPEPDYPVTAVPAELYMIKTGKKNSRTESGRSG